MARLPLGARFDGELSVQEASLACTFSGVDDELGTRLVLVEARTERSAPASLRALDVEQRLQSRDRMASIGTLAAGVVHGINDPLSYVIANLEYVKRLLTQGGGKLAPSALVELGDVLDDSLDGAERVRRIVSDLGSYSRPRETSEGAVDLERAADRALDIAANEIRQRARVIREYSGVVAARGSEAKLGQVILNVLINAAHAIEPGDIEHNAITVRTELGPNGSPILSIEDTGCGIDKANLSRVFDPFFTTKPVGVGAGLGLSIAQRIVRELTGEIRVESEHGRGTRVTLSLPAALLAAPAAPTLESVPPFSSDRFRSRILVIDDEPAILRAFQRVLSTHDVSVATSGREAMHKLAEAAPFDVIFCDVMMPTMSGVDVYQQIRQRHPGQEHKIVFMTGGAFAEPAAQFIESAPNPKLLKPFTGSSLRGLVATVTRLP
jgi:signal transduction histidine kinase